MLNGSTSSVSPAPVHTPATGYGYVLSMPRYVEHRSAWVRNASASALVVGVSGGLISITRPASPCERGQGKTQNGDALPPLPDAMRTPSAQTDARGDSVLFIDPAALVVESLKGDSGASELIDAGALAAVLVSLLGAAGIRVTTPEKRAEAETKRAASSMRAIRADHEPGIAGALQAIIDGKSLVLIQASTTPNAGVPGGVSPLVGAGTLAKAAGLNPSDSLRRRYAAALKSQTAAKNPTVADALAELGGLLDFTPTPAPVQSGGVDAGAGGAGASGGALSPVAENHAAAPDAGAQDADADGTTDAAELFEGANVGQ